jgi:adenosylhomocysteinase
MIEKGRKKIAWAYQNMPVLQKIEQEFIIDKPFAGVRIALSIHVEAKTACLAKIFAQGGAKVYLTGCNPLSTQDDVAEALVSEGIAVFCRYGATVQEYTDDLVSVLKSYPNIIIDDGGDLAALLHANCREYLSHLIGGCEETTTGVHRLKILEKEGKLLFPSIAVNNAKCKHLFDNRYGTGQSTLTAIMATTNLLIAGKHVVIAGYGMCGKGIALRARGMGAKVIVTEIDPVKACEAMMDGYDIMPMCDAAAVGDIFITATGCLDVITSIHYNLMKDGVILANAGHFDVEINIKILNEMAVNVFSQRNNIEGYQMPDGRIINLIAKGRLVNLAAGDGHPAEIMDLSFSLQALSARYLIDNRQKLSPAVYEIPEEIDHRIANLFLESQNQSIDRLTENQMYYLNHWDFEK